MMKITRSKATILFSKIRVGVYGLIAAIVIIVYVWQVFLAEVLSTMTRILTNKVEVLDATLLPKLRKVIGLKVQETTENGTVWKDKGVEITEILKDYGVC